MKGGGVYIYDVFEDSIEMLQHLDHKYDDSDDRNNNKKDDEFGGKFYGGTEIAPKKCKSGDSIIKLGVDPK